MTTFCQMLLKMMLEQFHSIEEKITRAESWIDPFMKQSTLCQKTTAIPGIGAITATAIVAAVGDAREFKNGRHLAAWIGLVPRQHSSGGKSRLLGISKHGDTYLRTLLIQGARTVLIPDDKAVAFLTDARLLHKVRVALVRQASKLGVTLRQSDERVGKAAFVRSQRYAHARQINRCRAQNRKLRTYLGRIIRDIERKTQSADTRTERMDKLLEIAKRIHSQPRKRSAKAIRQSCTAFMHRKSNALPKARFTNSTNSA